MEQSSQLKKYRKQIDQIDLTILRLLNQRGKSAQAIGQIKRKVGSSFHVPEREINLLNNLRKKNPGPLNSQAIDAIYREIMSACLALEEPLTVAYLGPEATFTHLAAIRKFGISSHFLPQTTLRQVFEEVANARVDYGIVPIENSTEGVVTHTLDLFTEFTLHICGEIQVEVHHNILAKQKNLQQIRVVYSHPHALAQCRQWLEQHLPHAKVEPVDSTAKAAEIAAKKKTAAAIASSYAATLYGLSVLRKNIEDHPNNFTRFLVIGRKPTSPTGYDKTSIMFSVKDKPGVLFRLLQPLAMQKINLSKIESRPMKKKAWEYVFFIDLDGHLSNPHVGKALQKMERECSFLQVLGSYPKEVGK